MNKTFILGVLAVALLTACATQPQTEEARLASQTAQAAAFKDYCVRDTGTRIKRPPDDANCTQAGRSFSQDELQRTGEISTAQALKRLDPRLY